MIKHTAGTMIWHSVIYYLAAVAIFDYSYCSTDGDTDNTRVQFEVLEGQPKGTSVGWLPIRPGFSYRFNEPSDEFALNSTTGEITTIQILDRETLRNDRYDFIVLSSQPTYPIEVRILIIDINDNAPQFPEPVISVSFPESAAPDNKVLLDTATDADSGINSVSSDYKIVAGNIDNKFRLDVTSNPEGDLSYLYLQTTGKLDRETIPFYQLNISVRDGGSPTRYGYQTVNVTILDVNDNPPIFAHTDYSAWLNESAPSGTFTLQVTATDADLGDNGRITYYLPEMSESRFRVDPETGAIYTTDLPNCPQQNCPHTQLKSLCPKSCVFTVHARDNGSPRQDGRAYVTISLIDANDHDPLIKFRYFPSTALFATVDENAVNGSVVAAVSVMDPDEGLNGETFVEIVAGNEMNNFRLESSQSFYIVRVHGVLDREQINKYNLTILASDKGTPAKTTMAYLLIYVNDINDHEPVFEKSEYSTTLSELSPVGTYVASITAMDEDTGINAQIFYSIVSGNNFGWFDIDSNTGLVVLKDQLDREKMGAIEMKISARDGGPNPKWAFTQLKVIVLDENDERPEFTQDEITVQLLENIPENTLVAMLTATDHDQGTNGSVSYSLHPEVHYKYNGAFSLDSLTGQLIVKTKLDREKISEYYIKVLAKDQGFPPKSSTATVKLSILDVNDNNPIFYPSHYVSLINDHQVGSKLLSVSAYDLDENSSIEYKLVSSEDSKFFNIDVQDGSIYIKNGFELMKSIYLIHVTATDKGGRQAVENAVVEIIKNPEVTIKFDKTDGYSFQIYEDHDKSEELTYNRYVGHIHIKEVKSNVKYFIMNGDNGNFMIDSSGILSTIKKIDRETISFYNIQIGVREGKKFGSTVVNITILDINDNEPNFSTVIDEADLYENTAIGQELCVARAKDKDIGLNSRVTYRLVSNPDELFHITESSGIIYLNKPVNVAPGTVLPVEIVATDSGNPSLSSKHVILFTVLDVNDHTPIFDQISYEVSLSESTAVNSRFFGLTATDKDYGLNARLSYFIAEGDLENKFGIFPDGMLYIKNRLDRETRDYYALSIVVHDAGSLARSSSVLAVIHITDENDNKPEFSNAIFSFMIYENEPVNTFVGKILASDHDSGRNAELTYSLINHKSEFLIDPKNGFIRTKQEFDREQLIRLTGQNVIVIEAIVSDKGKHSLQDKTKINVYINDVNDNHPQFFRQPYRVQVSESSSIGTHVLRVFASDEDDGKNGLVHYTLEDNHTSKFHIDSNSGLITINSRLDREECASYLLRVTAYDNGSPIQLNASTTVAVEVLDDNDNPPKFEKSTSGVEIYENLTINSELMKFHATDPDLGFNGEVHYLIVSGNKRDTFQIDSKSGVLYLHKKLDYEDINSYALNISAYDGGNPRLSSALVFHVTILDCNDNPPQFPSTAIVRQIFENIPIGTSIINVVADDPDSDLNGLIYYSITNQQPDNDRRSFTINEHTGVISTILSIDREYTDTYRLTVTAIDQAIPKESRLFTEKTVTIIVDDENDNAPVFVSMDNGLLRHRYKGAHIMYVIAKDADSNTNGLVTYEMVGGDSDLFEIHRTTGAITLRQELIQPERLYKLTVRATDEAVQPERKSTDAYITILTSVDSPEKLIGIRNYEGSVYENEPPGTSVLKMDVLPEQIEYYVVNVTGPNGQQADRMFTVDVKLGVLYTAAVLDREGGAEQYIVHVYATKAESQTPKTGHIQIIVTVLDKNDNRPVWPSSLLEFMISEEMPVGSLVATLKATDPDLDSSLTYMVIGDDDNSSSFHLDASTGNIRIRKPIDRETSSRHVLSIRVSDEVHNTDTSIVFIILDINDNAPVFNKNVYSIDISEATIRGTKIGEIFAIDDDENINGVVTYTVVSDWGNDVFNIDSHSGIITLTGKLDYEEVQHYILIIQAQDGGKPMLSSTVTVYINVIDENDNTPVFEVNSYSIDIYENVTENTIIATVLATDRDSKLNGDIKYSFQLLDQEHNDFAIDQNNGSIWPIRSLNRELVAFYNLAVVARDGARLKASELTSTTQITITIKDVNDCIPQWVTPNYTSVLENVDIGTVVTVLKAIDDDEERNGFIEYWINAGDDKTFTIGSIDGILRVSKKLDREIKSSYFLEVGAKDRGDPFLSSLIKLTVNILDENDNSPIFEPRHYTSTVPENVTVGYAVMQLFASDNDIGPNAALRFTITSGDENLDFSIEDDTGIIRVAKYLNYERKSRYVLNIRAEDSPIGLESHVNSDEIVVTITVQDINDNYPIFPDSPYIIHVLEEHVNVNLRKFPLVEVKATDADSGYNGKIRYFLKDTEFFLIDSTTGKIHLTRSLDREMQSEHMITIVAMDSGMPPLSGTGFVRVIVQDVNDHSPKFQQQNYAAYVDENSPVGYFIIQLVATDLDAGLNAKIKYTLLGDKFNQFQLDEDTGVLRTLDNIDREENDKIHLTVVAQDSSITDPKASAVNLTIYVNDINDNYPKFPTSKSTIYISDKTQAEQFIYGVTASDLDSGNNGKITYYLAGDHKEMFKIDKNTGVVESLQKLNKQIEYKIKIKASDNGQVSKTSEFELNIINWPARDFPVVHLTGTEKLSLVENSSPGSSVSRITATSPKTGTKGILRYSIAGGNVDNTFEVDVISGEIIVGKNGVDHEKASQYKLWLEASDSDEPSLRSTILLIVNVTDENDNPPVFELPFYSVTIQEETFPPTPVITVKALDKDTGKNGVLTYKLLDDLNGIFNIDDISGEIVTNIKLDRETDDQYTLIVEAIDQGYPSLTGSTMVHITVLDINDNPPRFTRLFSVNVTENMEIGSFVIGITSSDLDIGANANATYRFTENPGNVFKIDPSNGNVYVQSELDRENQDEYLLNVIAADGSWQAETPLTITVQDVNDNAPEFENSFYKFNFPESQNTGLTVGRIIAMDKDKVGSNSAIFYNFKHPSDLFVIDPIYGDIFTKRIITYKNSSKEISPENEFSLIVVATDNGKPPMSSECSVTINIIDSNNHAPEFKQKSYFIPIPISVRQWSPLHTIIATDQDSGVNSEIDYFIYGGNATEIIQLNKNTGLITLKKKLSSVDLGKTFELVIRATDRGIPPKQALTSVSIIITGENNYLPEFSSLSYQVFVPENEPIGTTILTVKATDGDEGPNGIIRYEAKNLSDKFHLNQETGAITIAKILDYEFLKEYKLNITASDLGFEPKQSIATVSIILTDINDNPPVFNKTQYDVFVLENLPVGTFVSQIIAVDLDSPKNAIINYVITGGSGENFFYCNSTSGVIYTKSTFDFEQEKLFTINLVATNPDSSFSGSTKVIIHIEGVNEYYPTFSQSVFYYDVAESAEIGSIIGAVKATDLDDGFDGEVFYLLVGSSNNKGFTIGRNNGLLRVSKQLDRETQNRIILTVLAKNDGSIKGNDTNEAQVIISVQDGNDPPEFSQEYYECFVSEGTRPGAKILTVHAFDNDAWPQNNQFTYSILNNMTKLFRINAQNGSVETVGDFDRETVNYYEILVGAVDTGLPPQTGKAIVKVIITDVNDNGPVLSPENRVGYVSENEPINTNIMVLTATDADQSPNGAPFTYKIVGGPHRDFVSLDESTGLLRTARHIDREQTPNLNIVISITDNGSPQITTENLLNIVILDQNDSPSSARTISIFLYSLINELSVGKIADVKPIDSDLTGDYKCFFEVPTDEFSIPESCDLYINKKIQPLTVLKILGNDGKHNSVTNTVTINYQTIDKNIIENTIFARINNITASDFILNHYTKFISTLNSTFEENSSILYNINEIDYGIVLAIAVRDIDKEHASHILRKRSSYFTQTMKSDIDIDYNPCQINTCENNGSCKSSLIISKEFRIISTQGYIFTSPAILQEFTCTCLDGYAGSRCEKHQDPCASSPCQYGGTCRRQGTSFQCLCLSNREGFECEKERYDKCDTNPCLNGGSCKQTQDNVGYFCLCRPGYRGNTCELTADSCRPNPCLNGGSCVSLKPGYKCNCPNGLHGRHCEKTSYGFNDYSYMTFPPLDSTINDITIVFSTIKSDSLLLYNYGTQVGGRSDFITIELIEGRCVFSYGGSRSSITSISVGKSDGSSLADGFWQKITAVRNGKVLSLSVASCTDNGDNCEECKPSNKTCYSDSTGTVGTLNFNGNNLLIGGVMSADPILERPGQVHSDDFVGCLHSVTVNGYSLNLSNPISSKLVDPFCNRQVQCSSQSPILCGEGSMCLEKWTGIMCQCLENDILSPNCYQAFQPVSLNNGAFLEYKISEKHRRLHLLENIYYGTTIWKQQKKNNKNVYLIPPIKELSLMFRTMQSNSTILLAASNTDFTLIKLNQGRLLYTSYLSTSTSSVNMTMGNNLDDGNWHNLRMVIGAKSLKIFLNDNKVGEELDSASVHDFMDPYLTKLYLGGMDLEYLPGKISTDSFTGCFANFTINKELQPFNGTGSIFSEVYHVGRTSFDCDLVGLAASGVTVTDPLSLGITLVIIFFVILIMAITVSFVVFKIRKQIKDDKDSDNNKFQRSLNNESSALNSIPVSSFISESGDVIRHHMIPPEILSKRYKDQDLGMNDTRRSHRPDIIEREVIGKSPPPQRDELNQHIMKNIHQHDSTTDHDMPEHYDLENASSIAPSDIDIIYHYKSYRDGNNLRRMKTHLSPGLPTNMFHKQMRHSNGFQSPHSRDSRSSIPPPPPPLDSSNHIQHQSTPLARLSPSSELSQQLPRILTLRDISGKPLQTALLATSSSGVVSKDCPMHSNSERSLNSPVMSGHSLSGSGISGSGAPSRSQVLSSHGDRRPSSLVSTVDAVSNSSGRPPNMVVTQNEQDDDDTSNTSSDESGNDSFTCSEIEYDNNSVSGEKLSDVIFNNIKNPNLDKDTCTRQGSVLSQKNHQPKQQQQTVVGYDTFDSSFRGSLSTLVASDDDGPMYRNQNNASESSSIPVGLGWDYLLNWSPNMRPPYNDNDHSDIESRQMRGTNGSRSSRKSPEEYV
ncbi:cadherin-related tumor suppressor [Daktulosphaira vitifoliae]|uniref:cadherin-related tumor suppressor n=1 Tax=Daktulosphaira vitifoliae TaxID=58002 RepID=UPI0021AA6348|nr:cadherin-related tumor suppressor [Daktulosphaira vitifoliae]